MADYQFDELTKDLAGAKSRRGFLKGLVSAGLAAAGVGTVLSGVASAVSTACPPSQITHTTCPNGTVLPCCRGTTPCCGPDGKAKCCPAGTTCQPGGGCK
jgi:hypothetical protein